MSATTLVWYRLRWPRDVEAEDLVRCIRLLATSGARPIVLEAIGTPGGVEHRLALPVGWSGDLVHQVQACIDGLAVEKVDERVEPPVSRAVQLRLSTRLRSLRVEDPLLTASSLLRAINHVGKGEALLLQWVLGMPLPALAVPNHLGSSAVEATPQSVGGVLLGSHDKADGEARTALRAKQAEPGWKVAGRLGVQAETQSRQRQLIRQVLGALKSSEAPGVRFWVRSIDPTRVAEVAIPWWHPLRLNTTEMAVVSGWPVGTTSALPVAAVGSRQIAPSRAVPRDGRVIAQATFPGAERPLSLLPGDALRHLHVLGPTGSGKSTLLLSLIIKDIAAGRGVVVIEPRGDLIAETLRFIPAERLGDVVLVDPADPASRPVGLNPLAPGGRSPELVADQLLSVFHSLFAAHWGPRTSDILGGALLTLARIPGMTLAGLPLLLSDAGFRRRLLAKIDDPIGLEPFWASFEAWSEAERSAAVAPAMRRLRPFLLRPDLRAIIGQAKPHFDVRQVFTERKILLVNLSKGLLGPETAALLGSLVVTQLWQATLGRSAVPPERRHMVPLYADEFQEYLRLPVDFADALAQARGLGLALILAHQYLHQLDPAIRSAVLANTQSRVAFRLPHDDARVLAAGGALEPEDFESLGAYQCYVQLVAKAAVQPWCSARTLLPGPPTSDPEVVRAASRARYGADRDEVESDIRRLAFGRGDPEGRDIGSRPRGKGEP